mmetsp:Transcript_11286/g.22555  ORF Transcript_11286/g.22555 Transcript_11286/m.22555 type:complete len:373 (+) Transcript_11286:228-1346(+)|eukprot:CAMPEP_0171333572 /NCGR_PEP_ID=MMETSP0878-20121228/4084_1 /TAXON_ID=67004 /ORGANISM="Thalassiosira weissflogii, Strain CCMP1336" /LENGTH=372 /DNA_ID=CAMNT_0011834519 /DNA_START=200 /DNA_END=1318 /DNA_ORIENTATION=+
MTLHKVIIAVALVANNHVEANTFPLEKPEVRYTPWQDLDPVVQNIAETKLGYTPVTWNVHGLADIERLGWWQMTPDQEEGAKAIGFNEETWDCFIHHYSSYLWSEIVDYNYVDHFRNLGWTESSWNGNDELPATEAKWWGQLTDDEKKAANGLCYFEDNWNMIDMNPNDSIFPHPKPDFRFVPWNDLPSYSKTTAENALGYDEFSWNNLGVNIAELNTFLNLNSTQREGLLEIGFYTHTWDCWMNHYLAYKWNSFHGKQKTAIETLGWTETSWNDLEEAPDTEITFWEDLTPEEKAAATQLCYFEETWNSEELTTFYDPTPITPTLEVTISGSETNAATAKSSATEVSNSACSNYVFNSAVLAIAVGTFVFT